MACVAMLFLFMCFLYITCIYLGKQEHLSQPKQVWRITFGCHKQSPGPVWVANLVLLGPLLAIKGGPFGDQKRSGGEGDFWQPKSVWETTFGADRFSRDSSRQLPRHIIVWPGETKSVRCQTSDKRHPPLLK